jgi:hypothetical protein
MRRDQKDRHTVLPQSLNQDLRSHLEAVRKLHEKDLAMGFGSIPMPEALAVKYPNADRSWPLAVGFPATSRYFDRETGTKRRHHLHESVVQRVYRTRFPGH